MRDDDLKEEKQTNQCEPSENETVLVQAVSAVCAVVDIEPNREPYMQR